MSLDTMIRYVLMYKLKNVQNIRDIAEICKNINAEAWLIAREDVTYEELPPNINIATTLEEAVEHIGRSVTYIVLETYSNRYLSELPEEVFSEDICIVVGAEDIGFPESEIPKLPKVYVAKIPMGIQGMSYNVVSSLVMAIEEIVSRCSGSV